MSWIDKIIDCDISYFQSKKKKIPRDMVLLKKAIDTFMYHVIKTQARTACQITNLILSKFKIMTNIERHEILSYINNPDRIMIPDLKELYIPAIYELREAIERRYSNNPITKNVYISINLFHNFSE